MRDDFAVFILTRGRPNNVVTLESLRRSGYTGRTYFVVDDEDETADTYRALYGADRVLSFNKDEVGETFDKFDLVSDHPSVVWARNACWKLAEQVGVRYFVQLDDDYTGFLYRLTGKREGVMGYHGWYVLNMDAVLEAMVRFMATTPAVTLCMSQGGDHMRTTTTSLNKLHRKAMNSFVCDTEKPFTFVGRVNEDVNTYVTLGATGVLLFSYMALQLNQLRTQSNAAGMTDIYLASGTYSKSMFTVIAAPSAVTVRFMGSAARRLHHRVSWRHAVPKIVGEQYRRGLPKTSVM